MDAQTYFTLKSKHLISVSTDGENYACTYKTFDPYGNETDVTETMAIADLSSQLILLQNQVTDLQNFISDLQTSATQQ